MRTTRAPITRFRVPQGKGKLIQCDLTNIFVTLLKHTCVGPQTIKRGTGIQRRLARKTLEVKLRIADLLGFTGLGQISTHFEEVPRSWYCHEFLVLLSTGLRLDH